MRGTHSAAPAAGAPGGGGGGGDCSARGCAQAAGRHGAVLVLCRDHHSEHGASLWGNAWVWGCLLIGCVHHRPALVL